MTGVYLIKNLVSGSKYVGSSLDIHNRANNHFSSLNANKHKNPHLQASYNKYGRDKFIFGVLEYCDNSILLEREQHYIDNLRPEYNIYLVAGNSYGTKRTQEQINKMVQNRTKNNQYTYGYVMSEETKEKIRQKAIGRRRSKDSINKSNRAISKPVLYVNKLTNETIEFVSVKDAQNFIKCYPKSMNESLKQGKPYKKYHYFQYLNKR